MTATEETVKHNGVIIPLRFEAGPLYLEIAIYVTGNRSVRRRSFRDDWQWRQWFVEMTRKWPLIVTGAIMKWEGIAERYNRFPVDSADFGFFVTHPSYVSSLRICVAGTIQNLTTGLPLSKWGIMFIMTKMRRFQSLLYICPVNGSRILKPLGPRNPHSKQYLMGSGGNVCYSRTPKECAMSRTLPRSKFGNGISRLNAPPAAFARPR
ncbi:hypothetical protein B0H14DRAFT_2605437 [Mycena olivaceomarginata]|nr:hypothetical protein B0H14DRAFT_2605437 [Mycena olivaceomarginata]